MMTIVAYLFSLVFAAVATPAAEVPPSPLAGVTDIAVFVEPLAPEIEAQGITAGVIGSEIIGRLKDAGLSVPGIDATLLVPEAPTLHVDILTLAQEGVEQVVYSIRLEFTQTVRLDRDPGIVVYRVPTWSIGGVAIGTREWRQSMINDALAYTDEFVNAFRAANPGDGGN